MCKMIVAVATVFLATQRAASMVVVEEVAAKATYLSVSASSRACVTGSGQKRFHQTNSAAYALSYMGLNCTAAQNL